MMLVCLDIKQANTETELQNVAKGALLSQVFRIMCVYARAGKDDDPMPAASTKRAREINNNIDWKVRISACCILMSLILNVLQCNKCQMVNFARVITCNKCGAEVCNAKQCTVSPVRVTNR